MEVVVDLKNKNMEAKKNNSKSKEHSTITTEIKISG